MKKSIKLKHGDELERLIKYPEELALLVRIAFQMDEELGYAKKGNLFPIKTKVLDNLILWGLVSLKNDGVAITSKKVVDFTLKKAPEREALKLMKMSEVDLDDVPDEEKEFFTLAEHFRKMFGANLKAINARTVNIENAKYGKWVDPIRLMMETDMVSTEQLREIYKFLRFHHFWSANVQSTEKLRQKFQTIHTQLRKDESKGNTKPNSARTTESERKNYN